MEFVKPPKSPRFHRAKPTQFLRNRSRRFISCELEIAGADHGSDINGAVERWRGGIVEDGSLDEGGFEICTAPAQGDVFVEQVEDICGALREQNAEVDKSCGYHVHVDARDFSYWDIRKLILLYSKLEDALFSIVPRSRQENSYCQPCGRRYLTGLLDSTDAKRKVIENVYQDEVSSCEGRQFGERVKTLRQQKYGSHRYYALNLHSWFYRGTVECRLAAGTTNAEKVVNWALLWAGILDYAFTHSEADIRKLDASWDSLIKVAPTDEVRTWLVERKAKHSQ